MSFQKYPPLPFSGYVLPHCTLHSTPLWTEHNVAGFKGMLYLEFLGEHVCVWLILSEKGMVGKVIIVTVNVLQVDMRLPASILQTHNLPAIYDKGAQLIDHQLVIALGVDKNIGLPSLDLDMKTIDGYKKTGGTSTGMQTDTAIMNVGCRQGMQHATSGVKLYTLAIHHSHDL